MRLKPLILKGRLRHAWCIENTFFKMLQQNFLTYLHPMYCPTRDAEVTAQPVLNKVQRANTKGQIFEIEEFTLPDAKLKASDGNYCVVLVETAFRRRQMGMDIIGLFSFDFGEEQRMLIMEAWDVDNRLSSCIPITFDEMIEID